MLTSFRSLARFCRVILLTALTASAHGQRLSPLATAPDWAELDRFQETITREEFVRLLDEVYAPGGAARGLIEVQTDAAQIQTTLTPPARWTLRFAASRKEGRRPPRFWRTAGELGAAPANRPLAGAKIAIDPGHIGGAWARMEERFFQLEQGAPVTEGDMTLRVAELLAPVLRELGAEVSLVRSAAEPTTTARPEMLLDPARAELVAQGGADAAQRPAAVQSQSELLFYRSSEIRHRARVVNDTVKPDLTVCLHFNAEAWGDPRRPAFVPRNHLHLLVNGNYSASELRLDDVRFEMLIRLLERALPEEVAVSANVGAALAQRTQLPPYVYPFNNARRVGESELIWARNLMANRLYRTPVIFLEPYVMNSQEVWERVQVGDYQGEKMVAGVLRKSIYREYADAVAAGLASYFQAARARPTAGGVSPAR